MLTLLSKFSTSKNNSDLKFKKSYPHHQGLAHAGPFVFCGTKVILKFFEYSDKQFNGLHSGVFVINRKSINNVEENVEEMSSRQSYPRPKC
jgi:hypothetical protein